MNNVEGGSSTQVPLANTFSPEKDLNQRVWRVAQIAFLVLEIFLDPLVDFFTQGLSDFLALETLRHGTSLQNYISIRLNGADPARGGKNGGGTHGFTILSEMARRGQRDDRAIDSLFFVTKDSQAYVAPLGTFGSQFFNRCVSSRFYCALSANATVGGKEIYKIPARILIMAFSILLVPPVKFRFLPEDISPRFENDPENACTLDFAQGLAYQTRQSISTDHIGLKGILTQGLKGNIGERMKAHPIKVGWGLIQLISGMGILILLAQRIYPRLAQPATVYRSLNMLL